jgi:hypothetical protein
MSGLDSPGLSEFVNQRRVANGLTPWTHQDLDKGALFVHGLAVMQWNITDDVGLIRGDEFLFKVASFQLKVCSNICAFVCYSVLAVFELQEPLKLEAKITNRSLLQRFHNQHALSPGSIDFV